MLGKDVTDAETLKIALQTLSDEIKPNSPPVAASTKYRKNLALSLFYKVSKRYMILMFDNVYCLFFTVLFGYSWRQG